MRTTLMVRPLGKAIAILGLALSVFSGPVHACDAASSCRDCAKGSEMSWNPENRFVTPRLRHFYDLDGRLEAAYRSGDYPAATDLANEYLALAQIYRCNWNYGNAIHDANRFLGLMSLKKDDLDGAAAYLRNAGKTTGSPQLNTFGPELDLANELLRKGRTDAVKAYLLDIGIFWKHHNGKVDEWLSALEKGELQELDRFPPQPSVTQITWFWIGLAWPALAVFGHLYVRRSRIARKWIFGVVALAAGYAALAVTAVGVMLALPRVMPLVPGSLLTLVWYSFIATIFVIPLLAIAGVCRGFSSGKRAEGGGA